MPTPLSRIDLNLLVVFQVLLEERNVTRAAERLFITQPAMSKTLQRLRTLFDDPLFTRTAHGLIPTPKAEQLTQPVNAVLKQLEDTVFTGSFDPATFSGDFTILLPEIYAFGLLPTLVTRLKDLAPGVHLHSRNVLQNHLDIMASDKADFTVYIDQKYPGEFEVSPLTVDRPMFWMRNDHPLAKKRKLTMEDVFYYPRVLLHFPNIDNDATAHIVRAANELGYTREEYFETSQLLTALEVLTRSDALMLGPPRLMELQLTSGHFVGKQLPDDPLFEILQIPFALIQHRRTLNSPQHRWLKEQIIAVCNEARA